MTLVSDGHVPDAVYGRVRTQFSERELVDLTLAIIAIDSWNRLSIASRSVAGSYQPTRPSERPGATH